MQPSRKRANESCVKGPFCHRTMHQFTDHTWLKQPNAFSCPKLSRPSFIYFFLFLKLKSELHGHHSRSDNIIHAVEVYLQAQDASFFQERIGILEHQ
jgi:hypothetical protein